jgi:hypothetical protein
MHSIDFMFLINFNNSKMKVKVTGESIEFIPLEEDSLIRPRHLNLIAELMKFMHTAMKLEMEAKEKYDNSGNR